MSCKIEVLNCPSCSSNKFTIFQRRGDHKLQKCSSCGLIYLTPREQDTLSIYEDNKSSSPSSYYIRSREIDEKVFKRRLTLLERFTNKGKILDIGSSVG